MALLGAHQPPVKQPQAGVELEVGVGPGFLVQEPVGPVGGHQVAAVPGGQSEGLGPEGHSQDHALADAEYDGRLGAAQGGVVLEQGDVDLAEPPVTRWVAAVPAEGGQAAEHGDAVVAGAHCCSS